MDKHDFVNSTKLISTDMSAHSKFSAMGEPAPRTTFAAKLSGPLRWPLLKTLEAIAATLEVVTAMRNLLSFDNYELTALHRAAKNGSVWEIETLLKSGAPVDSVRPGMTSTPMTFAAYSGQIAAVKCLLDHGADINAVNKFGNTALLYAADSGNLPLMKLLLDRGADTEIRGEYGDTAILRARACGHYDTAQLLLEHGAMPQCTVLRQI